MTSTSELTDEFTMDVGYGSMPFIEDAIRAATDKPRMPEPGWGEKVTASTANDRDRRRFVGVLKPWTADELVWLDEFGNNCEWDELIDPERAS